MDGFSSAALLLNYIKMQIKYGDEWSGCSPSFDYMFHEAKAHGLGDTGIMVKLRDELRPNLVIIPDASGSKEQYDALVNLDMDILVLDHHDMDERGDGERVVVVNNQQSERYTNKDLSGVGVVWQFCRYMDEKMTLVCADRWRDLCALGNCADVMDMRSPETRYIIMNGLRPDNINNYFLQHCQFALNSMREKDYNPHNISFYIAPLFNAVCRFGDYKEKDYLFRALIDDEAVAMVPNGKRGHDGEDIELVQEAVRLATNTKGRQDRRKNKLADQIMEVVRDEGLLVHKVLCMCFDDFDEEMRALTGLTANVIVDLVQRPVIVAFRKDDAYVGSLRVPDLNVPEYENFKDQCLESGCCTFAAGHQGAAGIGIKADMVEDFIAFFDERYENLSGETFQNVDFVIDANDPELPKLIEELASLGDIWGQGIDAPRIAVKNVRIGPGTISLMGKNQTTLAFTLPTMKFINFKSSREEFDSLCLPYDGQVAQYYNATVIGEEPELNVFANRVTPQMKIVEYDLGKVSYDF